MTIPLPHWERCEAIEQIKIPAPDGKSVPTTVQVNVPAWRDPDDGEIYFDGDSIRIIDDARARAMGLLTTEDLKALRMTLGLTQRRLSQLLKIGEKTWTRWESGRDRPSKSLNVMICALRDGKIDVPYLERLASGQGEVKETPTVKFGKEPEQLWATLIQGWFQDFAKTAGEDNRIDWITKRPAVNPGLLQDLQTGLMDRLSGISIERKPHADNIIQFQKAS